jgi:TonB family protein
MRAITLGCLLLTTTPICFGQAQEALCPKHIETPVYPQIARTAHITGKVVLKLTIDSDGKVTDAETTNDDKWVPLLKRSTMDNIRRWTFAKPPSAPYTDTIVYDYELDATLKDYETKVVYDLPDRVSIFAGVATIQPSISKSKN